MQNYLWGKRFEALIVDIIFIILVMWIIVAIIYPIITSSENFFVLNYWILVGIVVIMVYFTIMEGKTCQTLGKKLLKIRVEAIEGEMNYTKAFIRSISKILWFPLIVDVILGFLFGDSNDRFLDKVSKTQVVLDNTETEHA